MMIPNQNEAIYLPQDGLIEIRSLKPIIETPQFQRLRHRKQLGLTSIVFPSAIHTRMEHSFGSLAKIRRVIRALSEREPHLLTPELSRALEVFAMLHDIGHGPFSHVIERVLSMNHKQRGEVILGELKRAISQVADYELVYQLYTHQHPFHVLVSDTILGTDKMDYLRRDAATIGLSLSFDIDMMIAGIRWLGDHFGMNAAAVFHIIDLQWMYLLMYTQIYWHPEALIAERMMERTLLFELIDHPELSEADIYQLTDEELTVRLRAYPIMNRLLDERRLFQVCASLIPIGNRSLELDHFEKAAIFELDDVRFRQLHQRLLQKPLVEIEDQLAQIMEFQPGQVILSTPMDIDRLVLKDIDLINDRSEITTLMNRFPAHHDLLRAVQREYLAFRIALDPDCLPISLAKLTLAKNFLTEL